MHASFDLCYITDLRALEPKPLEPHVALAIAAGITLIQIREKDLPTRELLALAAASAERARGSRSRIIVNDRLDIALAAQADGVHLGGQSMPVAAAQRAAPENFLVGKSCHSLEEALDADATGSSYILLGPIFETPSKAGYGLPLGLEKLAKVAEKVKTPILALGGITTGRVQACLAHGATGVAGIRLFQDCDSVAGRVQELRAIFKAAGERPER
jgi:thiamine-phosphate pyrophosphorylase